MLLTTSTRLRWLLLIALLSASKAWALAPEAIQGETLGEMINALQNRHYEGKSYDDALSAAHLDA